MPYTRVGYGQREAPLSWPGRQLGHSLALLEPMGFSSDQVFILHAYALSVLFRCTYFPFRVPCICKSQSPFGPLCGSVCGMFRPFSLHQRTRTRTRARGTRRERTVTPHLFLLGQEDKTLDNSTSHLLEVATWSTWAGVHSPLTHTTFEPFFIPRGSTRFQLGSGTGVRGTVDKSQALQPRRGEGEGCNTALHAPRSAFL